MTSDELFVVADRILTVNTGSSSLKLAVYDENPQLVRRASILVDRIGRAGTRLTLTSPSGVFDEAVDAADHVSALTAALGRARRFTPHAVGHRIVHGGSRFAQPERITPTMLAELRALEPMDPEHMPQALAVVDAIVRRDPQIRQFACFDTAFHRSMPDVAQRYPLPGWVLATGVRRYGFHGLSCEYIVGALARLDSRALEKRLLIAHLGNGASITAVLRGASVDTTMGFSPCGGLMMGTRSGDLDPTIVTYLARTGRATLDSLERLLNEESGLLGVSGTSADMRDLLSDASPNASAAVELFCHVARKHIGALASVLGGVDVLVFTGGIGEHAASVRERMCAGLGYLGVRIDPARNSAHADVISAAGSSVVVRVMETDEESVIARHVRDLTRDGAD